jgi:hypothetical protein
VTPQAGKYSKIGQQPLTPRSISPVFLLNLPALERDAVHQSDANTVFD